MIDVYFFLCTKNALQFAQHSAPPYPPHPPYPLSLGPQAWYLLQHFIKLFFFLFDSNGQKDWCIFEFLMFTPEIET